MSQILGIAWGIQHYLELHRGWGEKGKDGEEEEGKGVREGGEGGSGEEVGEEEEKQGEVSKSLIRTITSAQYDAN